MAQAKSVPPLKMRLMEAAFYLDSNEPLVGVSMLIPLAAEVASTPPELRKETSATIGEVLRRIRFLSHGKVRGYHPSTVDSTACGYRWAGLLILRQMRKNLAPIELNEGSAEIVLLHGAQGAKGKAETSATSPVGYTN